MRIYTDRIDSEAIARMWYYPRSQELYVQWRSHKGSTAPIYKYTRVPFRVYNDMISADSLGASANWEIKSEKYDCEIVKEGVEVPPRPDDADDAARPHEMDLGSDAPDPLEESG